MGPKDKDTRLIRLLDRASVDLSECDGILVLNACPGKLLARFGKAVTICEQPLRPAFDALTSAGFRVVPSFTGKVGGAIARITRNRVESLGLVARALKSVSPSGPVVIDGNRTDGIEPLYRTLRSALGVQGTETLAHGRTFWLPRPKILPEEIHAWAEAAKPARNAAGFLTQPGLFSSDGPDPGSEILAGHLADQLEGRVADLGAGWGFLAQRALSANPKISHIDLYESDSRALEVAGTNVPDPRVYAHWSDCTRPWSEARAFDYVVSNPPFHRGRVADPSLGDAFIERAAGMLLPGGKLWLVANRQLPYERTLEANFARWSLVEETGVYKVLSAERPRPR